MDGNEIALDASVLDRNGFLHFHPIVLHRIFGFMVAYLAKVKKTNKQNKQADLFRDYFGP